MISKTKEVRTLGTSDFATYPVWEFCDEGSRDVLVRPVTRLPVTDMGGKLVGTHAQRADGNKVWISLGNLDLSNPFSTKHFLSLSIYSSGKNFVMARYHDVDWDVRGPEAVAGFLGSSVDEIFPISYDVSGNCVGDAAVIRGLIQAKIGERLTKAELIMLAVTRTKH